MPRKSKLSNGVIPPYTECPFKNECLEEDKKTCKHTGHKHPTIYSCNLARGLNALEMVFYDLPTN